MHTLGIIVRLTYGVLLVVHGGWTVWEDATQCSDSCGGGLKQQVRSCTNPVPQCGGDECDGEQKRNVSCNTQCCPGM